MKFVKVFPIAIGTILIFLSGVLKAGEFPLEVAEIYAPNSIVDYKGQKFILLDFWATWCAPCRTAAVQLEVLQEQFGDDVFMISVTDESHEAVEKYMKKFAIELMVVRDLGGSIFRQFNVNSRPYSVLLTSNGDVVWQGHPSDLKHENLADYIRQYTFPDKEIKSIDDILSVYKPVEEIPEDIKLSVEKSLLQTSMFSINKHAVVYYGSLLQLIAKIKEVPNTFIETNGFNDFYVHLESPLDDWNNNTDKILKLLKKKFDINIVSQNCVKDVYVLDVVDKSKLWDTNQIDWGDNNTSNHIIGEDRIQADNFNLADFCILLSNAKMKTYVYLGNQYDLHDWDVHFRFDDLMTTELFEQFGIRFTLKTMELPVFIVE